MWMGVSVENEEHMQRIDDLRGTGARVRFLSLEPLLGLLPNLGLTGIHWVIVGGESGHGARRDAERMGARHSSPMPARRCAFLF